MGNTFNVMSDILLINIAIKIFMKKNTKLCKSNIIITCIIYNVTKWLVLNFIFDNDIIKNSINVDTRIFLINIVKG